MAVIDIDSEKWYCLNGKKIQKLKRCLCIDCGKIRYVQKVNNLCVKCSSKRTALFRDQRGEKNPSWKGNKVKRRSGNARALKLYPKLDKCNNCDLNADVRHHIDNDTSNNIKSNILELCHKCHNKIHEKQRDVKGRFKKVAIF